MEEGSRHARSDSVTRSTEVGNLNPKVRFYVEYVNTFVYFL